MRSLVVRPHSLNRAVDNWFNDFFRTPAFEDVDSRAFTPRVDVAESDDKISLSFELPGMEKDQIKVMVKDGMLTVSGERRAEESTENKGYVRREIMSGSFERSFTLPKHVVADKIVADYKNGILEVSIPKAEEAKPKEISVKIA